MPGNALVAEQFEPQTTFQVGPVQLLASIVIVSYHSRQYLSTCLNSVLKTTGANCEIILVDNASSDGSADFVAQNFPEVKLICNASNTGFAAANNQAARLAGGRYLVALNPDTEVTPGWLEALLEPFDKTENDVKASLPVGLTTPKILMLKDKRRVNTCGNNMHFTGITVCRGLGLAAEDTKVAQSCEVPAVSGACFAIRQELWTRLGGFDETFFTYLEDTDLSLRARLAGYSSFYVANSVIYHDYTNRFSNRKLYFLERNRLLLLLKTYSVKTLLFILPALLLSEIVTWLYAFKSGSKSIFAKLKAYGWLLTNVSELRKKRKETQALRSVGDRLILKNIPWKLDTIQLAGPYLSKMANYSLNPLFGICFSLGKFLIGSSSVFTAERTDTFGFQIQNEKSINPSKKLKVAHVTATFPPYRGGTGNVCYNNARELVQLGHEVHVFTATVENAPKLEIKEGVTVHRLRPLLRIGNAPVLPGLLTALHNFDIVHLHYPFFGGELTTFSAWVTRIPLVITYHQDVFLRGWMALVEKIIRQVASRLTLRFATRLLFTSLDYGKASYVRTLLRGREDRIGALPNGVDTKRFVPGTALPTLQTLHGIGPEDKVALLVASLDSAHYFKGVNVFLEALVQLPANYKGIIVGDGDLRVSYEETARSWGIEARIGFAGRVSEEALPQYYRLADVTVLPSVTMGEAFGLVLIESMACGTPVIASNIPGVRTVVDSGEDGFLVKPNNPTELANALKKILQNDSLRTEMGISGRRKVEKCYNWEHIGSTLQDLYFQVLEKRSLLTSGGAQ